MTPPAGGAALIGREPVLTVLRSSVTAVVTGRSGSGLTSVLGAAAAALLDSGNCVVTGATTPRPDTVPLSYLAGLTVRTPDPAVAGNGNRSGSGNGNRSGSGSGDRDGNGNGVQGHNSTATVPAPLQDLPWFVERTAQRILAAATGRNVALVLDDLDAADALSLSALPLLQQRLHARLIGAGHAPSPGVYPRVALGALLDRLPRPSQVHLSGLDDDQCLQLARLRSPGASPALVQAVRPALGTWGSLPGLFLGLVDQVLAERWGPAGPGRAVAAGRLRLPDDHPLVRNLLARGPAATVVAAASAAGGLRQPDLELLATALATGPGRLAETVDDLTAEALLAHDDGLWRCTLPALATTLADLALPPAALVALAAGAGTAGGHRTGTAGGGGTGTAGGGEGAPRPGPAGEASRYRQQTAHRLAELAARAESALPAMLDLLIGTALADVAGHTEPVVPPWPAPDPLLRGRLLAAIASAVERAIPGPALQTPALGLTEAMLLASISGEERTSLRIAAAGTRLLRRTAAAATSQGDPALAGSARRTLARLRTAAATLPPPVTALADPRPRAGATGRRTGQGRSGQGRTTAAIPAPAQLAPGDHETAGPFLLQARWILDLAADGDDCAWVQAWHRWQQAQPGPVPSARSDAVRAMAGWGSRGELLTALSGHAMQGPVTAYLNGDWELVTWAGQRFLADPTGHRSDRSPDHDDLVAASLALLVAVDRREARTARTLYRRLAKAGGGPRPPVLGHALAAAVLPRNGGPASAPRNRGEPEAILHLLQEDLRRVRRAGPRNGLDLLLFAASRLSATLGRPAVAERLNGELSELAEDLATPRALVLAARSRLSRLPCGQAPTTARAPTARRARPQAEPRGAGGLLATPDGEAGLSLATAQLRRALCLPGVELGMGTFGRAQAMVVLAELLQPDDADRATLAAGATQLLTPLHTTRWLARARALLPASGQPGAGARSRATADQIRRLIAEGLSNRQISARLNLSEKSVEGYVTRLLRDHGCANRAALAAKRPEPLRAGRPRSRPT